MLPSKRSLSPSSLDGRRLRVDIDTPEGPPPPPPASSQSFEEKPVTWLSLTRKSQLIILALSRFAEPLTQTSVSSYLYYYLSSFHLPNKPPPSAETISRQAGIIASSFALAQCLTGVLWGRLSDKIGRKPCILFGLAGTAISVIGFGFSENLAMALTFRILGGCLNGNVGVLRTMVADVVVEKKYHSRAFLIMPICFNIGVIVGPAIGGILADPASTYPGAFGRVEWMRRWRYALPNLACATLVCISMLLGFLFLEETLESKRYRNRTDIGLKIGRGINFFAKRLYGMVTRRRNFPKADELGEYQLVTNIESGDNDDSTVVGSETPSPSSSASIRSIPIKPKRLPRRPTRREIFTKNIIFTLIALALIPLHNATFMHLWAIFLSTPRSRTPHSSSLFMFTGGLGLPAAQVGIAMSYIGAMGILMQLFLYPPLQAKLGLLNSFRISCMIFPIAYFLTPFLARVPSTSPPEHAASGWLVWASTVGVLLLQVTARTFATPGSVILLTNSVEKKSILGTVHGVGSSLASGSRAVGPVTGGVLYAAGLEGGVVGCVFWVMAGIAMLGAWWAWFLKEGRGLIDDEAEDEGVARV
ncbi:major facilitator superfamily domain-containing protein [Tuber borchii]|uniref:Major facilitator superfamily domain-containing protein n=1 Tax=Tuber borchii TaxID=42251 RepID=A0A2T7A1L1_TUBBO|nr:major facilitator superfamily domain-containing protein [Tuber borchii]